VLLKTALDSEFEKFISPGSRKNLSLERLVNIP